MAVISSVRSDDVYNQVPHYPSPDHRTTALAHQAAGLYIALYYVPHVLQKDTAVMRALVDRHFCDCWMVSWAPGFRADLALEWDSWRAARAAILTVATTGRARDTASIYAAATPELRAQLASYLVDGQLKEEYMLQRAGEVFGLLRQAAVMLRWLLLHTAGRQKRLQAAVAAAAPPPDQLMGLLLDTALLEYEVRRVYTALLDSKEERWAEQKTALADSIADMAAFYQALRALPRTTVPPDMPEWFARLLQQVEGMGDGDPGSMSVRVQTLLLALDDCERFHPVEAALQTRAYLGTIRGHLARLLRVADVRPEQLAALASISDFAYGWGLMDAYIPRLQTMVRGDAGVLVKLRALFVKLRSLLEVPLLRLGQARDPALLPVSSFYSSLLQAYARHMLQVVPAIMWEILDEVVVERTKRMAPLGARVPVHQLKEAAQLVPRARLAALAARAASYASGVHSMEGTTLGVIEIGAKQLLEEGIRAGLLKRMGAIYSSALSLPWGPSPLLPPPISVSTKSVLSDALLLPSFASGIPGREELKVRLADLSFKLKGFGSAFEDMQDFIEIQGLRIWMEERQRLLNASLEKEEAVFTLRMEAGLPVQDPPSSVTSSTDVSTFLGRLVSELLRLTDPQKSQFRPGDQSWVDGRGDETLDPKTLSFLRDSLGQSGLAAVDHLLALRMQHGLAGIIRFCRSNLDAGTQAAVRELTEGAGSSAPNQDGAPLIYTDVQRRAAKGLAPMLPALGGVGQVCLLRQHLQSELWDCCRFEGSALLADTLSTAGRALLEDARSWQREGQGRGGETPEACMGELPPSLDVVRLLESHALSDPARKVYLDVQPLPDLPEILLLLLLSIVGQYNYSSELGLLERGAKASKQSVDTVALCCGITVLLQQFHASYTEVFLDALGRCIRAYAQMAGSAMAKGVQAAGIDVILPSEVGRLAAFLQELLRWGSFPADQVRRRVPSLVLDLWPSIECSGQ
eukprot:jgi/Botrbrau1/12465/Bobra.0169s0012.2